MLVFLVTGVAGAGKSTVARRLSERGERAVSMDADDLLCSWTDPQGRRVPRPPEPDAAWLAGHRWVWDPARLDEIISEAARGGTDCLWLCGSAANGLQVTDRFAACFLLDIDQKTMARRLRSRTGGNDFGRHGDTLPAALASHTEFLAAWRRHGAITVDTTEQVDRVVEELLMAAATTAMRLRR